MSPSRPFLVRSLSFALFNLQGTSRRHQLRSFRFRVRPSASRENCISLRCASSSSRISSARRGSVSHASLPNIPSRKGFVNSFFQVFQGFFPDPVSCQNTARDTIYGSTGFLPPPGKAGAEKKAALPKRQRSKAGHSSAVGFLLLHLLIHVDHLGAHGHIVVGGDVLILALHELQVAGPQQVVGIEIFL